MRHEKEDNGEMIQGLAALTSLAEYLDGLDFQHPRDDSQRL